MSTKNQNILLGIFAALILSGCGSFTKMRYSRGFKSHFEFNLTSKVEKKEYIKADKAQKMHKLPLSVDVVYSDNKSQDNLLIYDSLLPVADENSVFPSLLKINLPKEKSIINRKTNKTARTNDDPKEPLIKWGYWLFLTGMAGGFYPPAIILSIIGLILVIFGLRKIARSLVPFRGKKKGIILIVASIAAIPLVIFNMELAITLACAIFILWVMYLLILLALRDRGWFFY